MASLTLCQALPGKLNKKKIQLTTIEELKKEASALSNLADNGFRLVCQGTVVGDGFDVKKLNNSWVMIVPMAETRPVSHDKVEPVNISEDEIKQFRLAFKSAIKTPAFSKVVKRLLQKDNMESLAAACPGLTHDLVAQAFLTRPELLIHLLDAETLKKVGSKHPQILEAAHKMAAAVHEEQASASRMQSSDEPAESEPGSYYLDEMSDEEMEEDDELFQGGRAPRPAQITPDQLAAALAAAAGGGGQSSNPFMGMTGLAPPQQNNPGTVGSTSNSGVQSAVTTPGTQRITTDFFQAAMQQAMMGMTGGGAEASNEPARPDWSSQLQTMREMGIVDEGLATQALQVMGGDLQAAVDLILSGWLGEDQSMQ